MELELGKTYINGLNEDVTIVKTESGNFPFVGDNFCRYMKDGRYVPKDQDYLPVAIYRLFKEKK